MGRDGSYGEWWLSGKFSALHPQGRRFEPHSSHHIGTLGKSFSHSCLYNVMRRPAGSIRLLLSSVYTLLVNTNQSISFNETQIDLKSLLPQPLLGPYNGRANHI